MSKRTLFWINSFVVAALVGGGAAALTVLTRPGQGSAQVSPGPFDPAMYESLRVIPFSMVDQNGNTVTHEALQGKWTVMSFMFTHCVLACPALQGNMYRLTESQALRGLPVQFMSVSVDPVNDTVERLNEYAGDMGVDYDRWRLLRGESILIQNFMSSLGFVPPREDGDESNRITLPDGSTMGNILHPNTFLVFNAEGQLVARYRGDDTDEVGQLAVDLRRAIGPRR